MIVQMNTRIDDQVKSAGDAAFAEAGYTPSQVVRAVWSFAERNRNDSSAISELLTKLRGEEVDAAEERKRRLKSLTRSESLVTSLLERNMLELPKACESKDYRTMRDQALEERYIEKGLL